MSISFNIKYFYHPMLFKYILLKFLRILSFTYSYLRFLRVDFLEVSTSLKLFFRYVYGYRYELYHLNWLFQHITVRRIIIIMKFHLLVMLLSMLLLATSANQSGSCLSLQIKCFAAKLTLVRMNFYNTKINDLPF